MELGATVCTPLQPNCTLCPLIKNCQAFAQGEPARWPQGSQKINYQKIKMTAALIRKNGKFLMVQRSSQRLLAGLWEFPMVEGDLADLRELYQFPLRGEQQLPVIAHSIMNRRITITPWLIPGQDLPPRHRPARSRWVTAPQIASLPTSSIIPKLLATLDKSLVESPAI